VVLFFYFLNKHDSWKCSLQTSNKKTLAQNIDLICGLNLLLTSQVRFLQHSHRLCITLCYINLIIHILDRAHSTGHVILIHKQQSHFCLNNDSEIEKLVQKGKTIIRHLKYMPPYLKNLSMTFHNYFYHLSYTITMIKV